MTLAITNDSPDLQASAHMAHTKTLADWCVDSKLWAVLRLTVRDLIVDAIKEKAAPVSQLKQGGGGQNVTFDKCPMSHSVSADKCQGALCTTSSIVQ